MTSETRSSHVSNYLLCFLYKTGVRFVPHISIVYSKKESGIVASGITPSSMSAIEFS